MGSIITVVVLVALFAVVIRYMWRKHKSGETSCGCGCSKCSHSASAGQSTPSCCSQHSQTH